MSLRLFLDVLRLMSGASFTGGTVGKAAKGLLGQKSRPTEKLREVSESAKRARASVDRPAAEQKQRERVQVVEGAGPETQNAKRLTAILEGGAPPPPKSIQAAGKGYSTEISGPGKPGSGRAKPQQLLPGFSESIQRPPQAGSGKPLPKPSAAEREFGSAATSLPGGPKPRPWQTMPADVHPEIRERMLRPPERPAPPAAKEPPQPPPPPPASPPPSPQPRSRVPQASRGLADWGRERLKQMEKARALAVPVSQEIEGLDWGQRRKRLEDQGALLGKAEVGQRLQKKPSARDVITESEGQQQKDRDLELGKAGKLLMKFGTLAVKNPGTAVIAGLVALPIALGAAAKGLQAFGAGVLETRRGLQRFDASIATVFARLERQKLMLAARTAAATRGSTTALGTNLQKLYEEVQPMREGLVTVVNTLGNTAVYVARAVNWLLIDNPISKMALEVLKVLGENPDLARQAIPFEDMLRQMAQGNFGNRARPGAQTQRPGAP